MKHPETFLPRFMALVPRSRASGLAACNIVPPAQDDPTRYFVLSDAGGAGGPRPRPPPSARIGLQAVKLEGYLKHKEMVVRTGANEIQFKDYRRWAEPLDAAVGRVLRASLVRPRARWPRCYDRAVPLRPGPRLDVSIDVRRCEGALDPSGKYKAELSRRDRDLDDGQPDAGRRRKLFEAPGRGLGRERTFDRLASLL
jgi:uncharacterized lipoprotein YmbA